MCPPLRLSFDRVLHTRKVNALRRVCLQTLAGIGQCSADDLFDAAFVQIYTWPEHFIKVNCQERARSGQ